MATVALPSTGGYVSVRALRRNSTKLAISGYNFTQQVYSWEGLLKVIEIQLTKMSQADFDDWTLFFNNLNGYENTFNIDLSDYFPDESGITSVAMRLADPEVDWQQDLEGYYSASFTAMEAK